MKQAVVYLKRQANLQLKTVSFELEQGTMDNIKLHIHTCGDKAQNLSPSHLNSIDLFIEAQSCLLFVARIVVVVVFIVSTAAAPVVVVANFCLV